MERRRFGMRPGLEVMRAVLEKLGNPQDALRYVHVAGTNGKGATCAILDAILRAAGYRVARYTSPHLVSINERFCIDGKPVSDEALAPVVDRVLDVVEQLERARGFEVTFFETLTAVAFQLFAEAKPDVVVLETGLGGRLDATNVVKDVLVSVITRIGLDHCD
ncbi:MAG: bifunctional folylpolyglutamate synthase/dihydrofolate synthase, partial [Kiritimatiellia bacterium]